MSPPYDFDRNFTNTIHDTLALPRVYAPLGWTQVSLDEAYARQIDMEKGIDYVFKDASGELKTVQERFRESKYKQYSDFTIRYRRDHSRHESRVESEYYKMKADYFLYGITNCLKVQRDRCTDFIKYALIDLQQVYQKLDEGLIVIEDNGQRVCAIRDGKIISPIQYNRDQSSSFIPIEISYLIDLWGDQMVLAQKGFV